jgi:hypothetical protein
MKKVFTKYMYLVVVIVYGLNFIFARNSGGINKTVGWAYDISNQIFYNTILLFFSQCLFFVGYLIIAILRRYTNFNMSIIHFAFIVASIGFFNFECFIFSTIICLLSIITFLKNTFNTYKITIDEIVK